MADFCKQCSLKIFGEDFGDLAGLSMIVHTSFRMYCKVICEGCGVTQVDHTGKCVSKNCLESVAAALSKFQKLQDDTLYRSGEYHSSHDMFIDLDDMWRGCVRCKTGDQTIKGFEILKQECKEKGETT